MFQQRTALVTGGSDGIGLEIARALTLEGARVLLPVRNREKGERAIAHIRRDAPNAAVELLDLDLARLDSVAALVNTLRVAAEPIDLLVLNAGIVRLGERERTITPDGFELAFQTNFLGHFMLTTGVLPLLRAGEGRIAVQCSLAAAGARVNWGDLRGENRYRAFRAYRSSKTALGLFALELARRSALAGWGLSVHLCHPGIAPASAIAPAVRAMLPERLVQWITARLGNPPEQAARTALAALAASPAVAPRMFAPAGLLEFSGPPRERDVFAALRRPGEGRLLWDRAELWTRTAA